jgi:hypothetical protein
MSAEMVDNLNPPGSRFRAELVIDEDDPDQTEWEVIDHKYGQSHEVPNGKRATAETQAYERNAKAGWDA